MNISWTIIMSIIYLIIILLILSNINSEFYLEIKYFFIRIINLDLTLLTEILSKFAKFILSFYTYYKDKKYNPIEFIDKPYYTYPPYLKDLPNCKEKNCSLENEKKNNKKLAAKNKVKINQDKSKTNQVKSDQIKPLQEKLNKSQSIPVQENLITIQPKENKDKSKNEQVELAQQKKSMTKEMDKVIRNIMSEEVIKKFIDLFPKPAKITGSDGYKSIDEIQFQLPKKELYGVYKNYDVFSELGQLTLY